MNTSQYGQYNDDPYNRMRPRQWPQNQQYSGDVPITYPNQPLMARRTPGPRPLPQNQQYGGAPDAYPNQPLLIARKAQGARQARVQAKPARMPKERALALARSFKRSLAIVSLGAFALFSGLAAYHQVNTASTTTSKKSSSSTSTTTSSSQNSSSFLKQQGGSNLGTGSSSSSSGSSSSGSSSSGTSGSSSSSVSGTSTS